MSLYTVKTLDDRTGFKGKHRTSPFDSAIDQTHELLRRELGMLRATNVILEMDVLPGQLRLDGQLKANAKVTSPAVRLHFDTNDGHMNYRTDAFRTWQDNLRAIALGLESLRRIRRYELNDGDEQYQGFLALESGSAARDAAMETLVLWSLYESWDDAPGVDIYRSARAQAHPDRRPDGDRGPWDTVEAAAKVLGL